MRRSSLRSALLTTIAGIVVASTPGWSAEQVGVLGDPSKIVVEGVTTFPAADVHKSLRRNPHVQYAGHRTAPLDGFLKSVRESLVSSFHRSGFDRVQVDVEVDRDRRVIVARITEGPRTVCGPIQITGLNETDATTLRKVLLKAEDVQLSPLHLASPSDGNTTETFEEKTKDENSEDKSIHWKPDTFLKFNDKFIENARATIDRSLISMGRVDAKFDVRLQRDETNHELTLVVEFADEGTELRADEIIVRGLSSSPRELLLSQIGLRVGDRIDGARVKELKLWLWNAARFWKRSVTVIWNPDRKHTSLVLEVVEHVDAPPLGKPHNERQSALIKVANWLNDFDKRQDAFRATVTMSEFNDMASGKADIISVAGNIQGLLDLEIGDYPRRYAFLATNDGVGMLNIDRARKLVVPPWKSSMKATLSLLPDYEKEDMSGMRILLGAGFSSDKCDHGPGQVAFRIDPVATVQIADHRIEKWEQKGNIVNCETDHTILRFDATTGRVFELREESEDGLSSLRISFGKADDFAEESRAMAARLEGEGTNLYQSSAGFASFVGFVLGELIWHSRQETGKEAEVSDRADRLADLCFKLSSTLLPFDNGDSSDDKLAAPEVDFGGEFHWTLATDWTKVVPVLGARYADDFFPRDTWPWAILREIGFVTNGKSEYVKDEIVWLYKEADMGPLGCLSAAYFAKMLRKPKIAQEFARMGLDRLQKDRFLADVKLFVHGEHFAARIPRGAFELVRSLEKKELSAAFQQLKPEFLKPALYLHHWISKDGREIERVMLSFADTTWEALTKDLLERQLTSRTFFPTGFRRDSPFQPQLSSN